MNSREPECIFCKFASHEIDATETFYEDNKVLAILDRDWSVKGHSLVIWKEHTYNISDLSEEDFTHFSKVVRKTEEALLNVLNVDKSVVLKSGGIVSHFHFHMYPVRSDMPWESILALFRQMRNEPAEGESAKLVSELQEAMNH